jgi:shikimate dehydrogenase
MGVTPRFEVLDLAATPAMVTGADVVVSTMPAYAADPVAEALRARGAQARGVLLDVVYDPRPTALSRAYEGLGGTVVGGERMLLHQAVEQVRLMTGRPGPEAAMDAALQGVLAAEAA